MIDDDLGAPLVGEGVADGLELRADHREQPLGAREDVAQIADQRQQFLVLGDDLVLFQPGQAVQAHVQDRLRLGLGEPVAARREPQGRGLAIGPRVDGARARQHLGHGARIPEPRDQCHLRLRRRGRGLDGGDHLVDVGERDRQALQDVAALARLAQIEHRAPRDDFAAVAQERLEHLLQTEQARLAVDQRHHVDAEHLLHRRLREQIVQQDLGHLAALQLDDDAHAVLVRLVAQAVRGDALDELLAHQIRDALDQLGLVDLVRAAR